MIIHYLECKLDEDRKMFFTSSTNSNSITPNFLQPKIRTVTKSLRREMQTTG